MAPPQAHAARTLWACGLVAAVALLAYANSFGGVLVLDDHLDIVGNARLHELAPRGWPPWAPAGAGLAGRPLSAFTLALNWAWTGPEPWAYHLLNLLIHASAGCMLFLVLRRALADLRARGMAAPGEGAALAAAALWTAHPLCTSAVTYVVQRCESLMALFFLAAFHAAQVALAGGRARWSVWAALAAWMGAASKEGIVVLPLLVLAYGLAVRGERWATLRAHRGLGLGLASSWIALAALTATSGGHAVSVGLGHAVGPWEYLQAQTLAIPRYMRLALWPEPLLLDYGWWRPASTTQWVLPGLALLALLAATAWALARKRPIGFAGAWWFLVLAPSSSVLPIATQLAAEHRAYLPLAGWVAALAVGAALALARGLKSPRHRWIAGTALTAPLLLALVLATRARNADYRSEDGLWLQVLAAFPDNPRAHTVLGDLLRKRGDAVGAREHYRRAVELQPEDPFWRINYGVSLFDAGSLDAAAEQLATAVRLQPDYALAWGNLGQVQLARNRFTEALEAFRRALALDPTLRVAQRGIAFAFAQAGEVAKAIVILEKWLETNASDAAARALLERLRREQDRPRGASGSGQGGR